ncbi:MAG: hypothetical protein KDC52_15025 [Ignavibacteriae bacterium]|nr:hypothetical protein [Saprospiraceae bacterium]MCB0752782.1 hypothetical protein [Ignavibacteriota bacterium]
MIDYLGIVGIINRECKVLFVEPFKLVQNIGHNNIYLYRIEGTSTALNRYDSEPVKVLKWFDKYWLFIELKFIVDKSKRLQKIVSEIHTNISISVYEGEDSDEIKTQLFRAEWDDFNNPEELHSQPHWHITSSQAIEKTFEDYSNHFDNGDFVSLLEDQRTKFFDVKRIHFAMNGNWQEEQSHIHKIKNPEQVSKWLMGLLNHIRVELEK